MYVVGLAVWLVLGIVGGVAVRALYRTEGTVVALTVIFAVLGAFIGGMLGTGAYIHHDPNPLRLGGLIGSAAGALLFSWMYHFVHRTAL